MASLWQEMRSGGRRSDPVAPTLSVDDYFNQFGDALKYGLVAPQTTFEKHEEQVEQTFRGYIDGAYKRNGVVFACMLTRMLIFSEARLRYRRDNDGRPGSLFSAPGLKVLEEPWPNGTTGDLLSRMIQDVDLAGNSYTARRDNGRLRRMRPDWVTIILGSETDSMLDAEIIGYAYQDGGPRSGEPREILLPDEVAHFAPIPDPAARFRGMSWLTPVLGEIQSDRAATTHKQKFFENGATPNLVVKLDPAVQREAFNRWVEKFEERHTGAANAYRTLYLGGGADAKIVGANFRELEFTNTQGHGETRIAAAAGVPPVIVGLSEGLKAATYSNYGQARRRLADGTMRPLWRSAAAALQSIVTVPRNAELWYDDRDISFLKEDVKDAAEIQQIDSLTIQKLIEAGFEPKTVIAAVTSQDMGLLEHTGLVSVQLQPPNPDQPAE